MEKRFPRSIDSLHGVFRFVSDYFAANGIASANQFDIDFMIEEIFTNQVKYAKGTKDILIALSLDGDVLTVSVTDFDVEPFDPTKSKAVDISLPLKDRKPGGLGIHLVKDMADSVDYEYRDRQSKITITKKMEK